MTYATASKDYREGATFLPLGQSQCDSELKSLGFSGEPTSYKPDSIWSYELGAKTEWFDHKLRLNGDVYYIKWHNLQQEIQLKCGFGFIANFGSATSKGAEWDVQYEPIPGLRFAVAGAFNEARLDTTGANGSQGSDAQGSKGDTLQNAPKWSGTASAEYSRSFIQGTTAYTRFDVNTSSYLYNNFDKTSIYHRQAGYSLANLRFGVRRNQWQATLFASNLFDKRAETALPFSNALDLPTTRRLSLTRPRTIGLDFRIDY